MERVLSRVKEEVEELQKRSSQQRNQIRELFARDEVTASKAELHAVMASLTYKDRMAVTNESISSAIEKIFEGNRHGHNSAKLSQDVERFLSNPYESIAALADRIGKMEALHKEEKLSASREIEKLKGELSRLQKSSEETSRQFFKLQSSVISQKFQSTSQKADSHNKRVSSRAGVVVDSDHSDAFVLSKENGMSPASSDSELEVNETLGGVTEEKKGPSFASAASLAAKVHSTVDVFSNSKHRKTLSAQSASAMPSQKKKSTVRFPSQYDGPSMQQFHELEKKTEQRLLELEASNLLLKKLLSAVTALNEEHDMLSAFKTDITTRCAADRKHFKDIIQHLVSIVEKNVSKLEVLESNEINSSQLGGLQSQVEDIRKDLQILIQETMREAKPSETGVVFEVLREKSLSTAEKTLETAPSMTSKEIPGVEDIRHLVEGLKRLDGIFQKKCKELDQLASSQQSTAHNVSEVENSMEKLKYLVLNSIQVPEKPLNEERNLDEAVDIPVPKPSSHRVVMKGVPLENYEMNLKARPVSSSACRPSNLTGKAAPSAQTRNVHTAPSHSFTPSDKFCDDDFFSGNFEVADRLVDLEKRTQPVGSSAEEVPPASSCPSHSREMAHVRSKRSRRVDLVRGISSAGRTGKSRSKKEALVSSANDDTLQNLTLEWGSNQVRNEDWSRTVDFLRQKKAKGGSEPQKREQSRSKDKDTKPRKQDVAPTALSSNQSNECVSVMSSITDA